MLGKKLARITPPIKKGETRLAKSRIALVFTENPITPVLISSFLLQRARLRPRSSQERGKNKEGAHRGQEVQNRSRRLNGHSAGKGEDILTRRTKEKEFPRKEGQGGGRGSPGKGVIANPENRNKSGENAAGKQKRFKVTRTRIAH